MLHTTTFKSGFCITATWIFFIITHTQVYSQNIEFSRLGVEDGLSNSTVTQIVQDNKGFLWVGTVDGLNRYDGYGFKVYRHKEGDSTSLIKNDILCLFKDKKGLLWVSTRGGGLQQYEPKQDKFIRINKFSSYSRIFQIIEDENHTIWVAGAENGKVFVANLHTTSGQWNVHNIIQLADQVKIFITLNATELLIGFQLGGIYKYNIKTSKLELLDKVNQSVVPVIPSTQIRQCGLLDNNGNVWVARNNSLLKISVKTLEITQYNATKDLTTSFLKYPILSITMDGNFLWIGTENGGLGRFDIINKKFETYIVDTDNPKSVSDNSIWSVYKDHQGRIWAGTYSNGLCVFDKNKNKFNKLNIPLKNVVVNAIYEDHKNRLWLATEGGLVMKQGDRIQYFQNNPDIKGSLSSNAVQCIAEDKNGELLFGTWNGGVNRYDEEKNNFIHYLPESNNIKSLSNPNVFFLQLSKQTGHMLVSTFNGLNIFIDDKNGFEKYIDKSVENNLLYCLYEDLNGDIWTGSQTELNRINPHTKKRSRFYLGRPNDSTKSGERITYIYQDKKNDLWVGTANGLYKTTDREHFVHYSTQNGLPSNMILGILEDEKENLWISTSNGLSKFNLKENTFINFNMSDGLLSNDFKLKSCFKSKDGKFYFGGKGVNYFYPDSIHLNNQKPEVYITDLKIFNKPVTIGDSTNILLHDISETNELSLAYKYNFFSFNYVGLNFTAKEKNQYAYKLEGFNKDWIYVGNQRTVSFTNLDPGDYTFRVKACNNDGLWNEKGASISIHILPPWWATWWFRTLTGFMLILCAIGYYRIRVRSIINRNKKLADMVSIKTIELQKSNHELIQRDEEIQNQNKILANQQEELAAQNEELIQGHEEILAQRDVVSEQNLELIKKQNEIEAQNEELVQGQEEIAAQRDIVAAQNEKLHEAQRVIENQNREIRLRNENLEFQVEERTKELIEYNQQLEQFAFITAHNLRAPVARILGLGQVLDLSQNADDEKIIYNKLIYTTKELDRVVRDLNTILDVRSHNTHLLTDVDLNEELKVVQSILEKEIMETKTVIHFDFSVSRFIRTIKPYIESILTNLISNAIKYRNPDLIPVISLKTEFKENYLCLIVKDNGLGIDLNLYNEKLFTLYSRFHNHVEGKGLGLYLVKTQVLALGGKIEVESQVNNGITFYIYLKHN